MTRKFSSSALVTDGLWRKSVSAIRSLGRAGFDIDVMGDSLFTTGFWSRYTAHRITAPTAARDPEGFGTALVNSLERRRGKSPPPVIFAMEDPSLMWVARHQERLSGLGHVLLPSLESLEITQDKGATLRIASALGLHCPGNWEPDTVEAFTRQVLGLETGSFVVKPRSGTGSAGVLYGPHFDERAWQEHWKKFGKLLIQERIPKEGKGQGVSLLFDRKGECVASFGHERLKQYPNSGGPSTDRHGIHAPELVEMSIALMKRLSWRGIAMVEWKIDPRDGKPKLMEINPRFWGSLELAVRSGVDFPHLFAKAALGEKLGPPPQYQAGVRCRWMIPGDILRYLSAGQGQRESLGAFLRGLPGLAEEWDPKDLRGTLSSLICTGALAVNPRYWKYVLRG